MRIGHLNKSLFFLLILLTVAVCISPAAADYTTFHGDAERSGTGDAVNIIHSDSEYVFTTGDFNSASDSVFADFTTQKVLVKLTDFFSLNNPTTDVYNEDPGQSKSVYSVENGAAVTGSPAVCNGYIYYGTSAGVVCYKIGTKEQSWNYTNCGAVKSGISVAGDRIWFGTASGKLCSLNLNGSDFKETGVIDSSAETGLSSTPLVVNDRVYVTTQTPAYLKGYSTSDLAEIVNVSLTSNVAAFSSPSANGNTIYTSGMDGIVSYDADGSARSIQTTGADTGTPVYHNGWVYAATASTLYGVNIDGSGTSWSKSHEGFATAPVVTDGLVILNSKTGLVAYDAENGNVRWTHDAAARTATMLSVPYAVDKSLTSYDLNAVSPISPVSAGDIVYYAANFGTSAADGRSILFGVNIADGRDSVPAALEGYKYYFSVTYAINQNMLVKTKNSYYNSPVSSGVYQLYLKSSINKYSQSPVTSYLKNPPATITNTGKFSNQQIQSSLTADGSIVGTKSGKIYDYVYPYHAVIENSWITTASPAVSDGYLIAGYTGGTGGSLIIHGAKTIPLYTGELSLRPSESTSGISVPDATPWGILDRLKRDGKITQYTVEGSSLTQINDIANAGEKTWSVTIDSSSKELTSELEHRSLPQQVVFTYGTPTEAEYRITVNALVKTEQIAQQSEKVPESLYIGSTDIQYTTIYGVLTNLQNSYKLTFTSSVDKKSLTKLNSIENSGDHIWYSAIGGEICDLTKSVSKNTQILLYYGPKDTPNRAIYSYSVTVSEIVPWATVNLASEYNRVLSPNQESTATVIITDWHGNKISPASNELTWSQTSSNEFTCRESEDKLSLTYTSENTVGSNTQLTVTYAPTTLNNDRLPSGTSITKTSDRITIISDQGNIPSDSAIETTQTYTTSHGNPARTGVVKGSGPQSAAILWELDLFSKAKGYIPLVDGDPIVYNGSVYFSVWGSGGMTTSQGSYESEDMEVVSVDGLYCVDATTGKVQWYNKQYISRGGLAVHNGVIYGGTTEGMNGAQGWVFAVDADTGQKRWNTSSAVSGYAYTGIASSPLIYNDKIYVITRTASNEIVKSALEIFTDKGTTYDQETIDLTPVRGSSVAEKFATASVSPDGTIYVPGFSGIAAINSTTNSVLWVVDSGARGATAQGGNNQFVGTPVYYEQRLYFASTGALWCINPLTGKTIWKAENSAIKASTPVVTHDRIIVSGGAQKGSYSYGLSIYDHAGNLLKSTTEGQLNYASPIVAENIAYFGTFAEASIYAVNIDTGETVWTYKPEEISNGWLSLIEALPAIENGILYVGAEDGKFYAIGTPGESAKKPFEIITPAKVTAGVDAVFATNITSSANTYKWDFGDGTTGYSTGTIRKIWKNAGTYTVTASIGDNKKSATVTVQQAPGEFTKGRSQVAVIKNDTKVPIPPENRVTLQFSNSTISGGTPEVTIAEFEVVKEEDETGIILEPEHFDTPPNTKNILLKMNVTEVTDVASKESLSNYAWLYIQLPISDADKDKLSFWRYADGSKAPERLKAEYGSYSNGMAGYNVYIPGFSTIVATVDETAAPVIEPPKETTGGGGGGSSSGSSYSGFSFTSINPGTGTVTYTTNHPDWPATTFTINRMTALGVLLASGKSVVSAERWGGVYIHSINGLSPASDSEGWMYQVNGISPGAMANNYPVSNGDKVVWYYSEDMTKPVSASKQVYAFTVSTSTAVSEITGGSTTAQPGQTTQTTATTVKPAETNRVTVGIPDGINVEKLEIGQKITIDTAVTKLTGTVNVNSRSIVIIQPGIQITIPLADVVYNGDVATATIRGMTAEIVPAPVTVPKGGYAV